jgi:hypothetical protein
MSMNEFRRLAAKIDQHMQQLSAQGVNDPDAIINRIMGYVRGERRQNSVSEEMGNARAYCLNRFSAPLLPQHPNPTLKRIFLHQSGRDLSER